MGAWSGGPKVDMGNYAALGGFIFCVFCLASIYLRALFSTNSSNKKNKDEPSALSKLELRIP